MITEKDEIAYLRGKLDEANREIRRLRQRVSETERWDCTGQPAPYVPNDGWQRS